ncbi:MAG: nucleotidyl transferase AbiEii/AbiGii toxin family protein [Planctomycetota bacterium]
MIEQFLGSLDRVTATLQKQDLQFALIGGLASSIRGRVRVTADIDIVIDCDVRKAVEFLEGLDSNVYRPFVEDPQLSIRQFYVLPIEDLKSRIRIDLAVGASGFEKMIVQRARAPEGYSIPVATAEDLLLMKLMAGRTQDNSDIKGIVDVQRDSIDWDYCITIAGQLQEAFGFDLVEAVRKLQG